MTRADMAKILAFVRGAYPHYYAEITSREVAATVDLWLAALDDLGYDLCKAAVVRFAASDEKGFPPVPGQIRACAAALCQRPERTAQEAWSLVARAVRNSSYHAADEFAALPPDVQQIVGDAAQLQRWAALAEDEFCTVVASNFQRSYQAMKARQAADTRLPPALRAAAMVPAIEEPA